MAGLKRRTKALLTAILPGGHGKGDFGLLDAPSSPTSDADVDLEDLWDAPLAVTAASAPDVNSHVRDIIGWLYDDTITEEVALEQMLALTQKLTTHSESAVATSRGCSPLPVPSIAVEDVASAAADKVDAGTDPQTARPRLMADVATETPAEMSYIGTPRDTSAAPSQGPASPRRMGAAVPILDLAALVAQAMEEAPLSGRSTASTVSTAGAPSFSSISQFVLAQPEKLQRLILRHAAATGGKSGQSGFGQPRVAQSPYGAGLLPSVAAASTTGAADLYGASSSASLMDPAMQLSNGGNLSTRPSLTSRLLGGLGNVANVANRAPPAASPQPAAIAGAGNTAGAVSGVTVSPAKAAKRFGSAAAPKFAKLDGAAQSHAPSQPAGPVYSMPGIKLLSGQDEYSSNIGNSSSGANFKLGAGLPGTGAADLDADFKELSLGGSSSALGFFKPGGSRH